MNADTGKYLMIAGAALTIIGLIVYFLHDKLEWIGRLPGDVRIVRNNFRFYFPITTMILLSVLVSGILWLIRKL